MSDGINSILVTGATGFVGTALCPLLTSYREVRAALWQNDDERHLPDHLSSVVIGSIGRDTDWREALHGIDLVIHLAARVHVMRDISLDPLGAFREVNTFGTESLARQAVAAGARRLVFVSTIKVNGEQTRPGETFKETDVPDPQDPYAISKMEAELALTKVAKETGLEVVIIRPPIMYGAGVKANFLALMKLVNMGIPLPTGSIANKRSLLFVKNLADFIARCVTNKSAANQVYLLGDGKSVTTTELITSIARAMKKSDRQFAFSAPIARAGARIIKRENFYSRLWGSLEIDSSKARDQFGWRPPYSFSEGIDDTVNWYLNTIF
jgi:nucleoside-diphosphate-sugar epimerase